MGNMGCRFAFGKHLFIATFALLAATTRADAPATFPFVLPWDDATQGATDLSGWLSKPAGGKGAVTARDDGHFYTGNERIRFFGVNLSFGAGLPEKADAEKLAARMAKFGINVVRFHHMDTSPWPRGLRARDAKGTGELAPEALDRLDYFVAQLKARGIHANINLLVGRPFNAGDGLPAEIEKLDWKERHIIGSFDEQHLALQKNFASALLARTNAYTGRSYTDDPAIAFVEINNEQGLVHAWLGGEVDRLPAVFADRLRRKWNAWLRSKYPDLSRLNAVWAEGAEPLQAELLRNAHLAEGHANWVVERHEGAQAELALVNELPTGARLSNPAARTAHMQIKTAGQADWHLQLNQSGLSLRKGQAYTVAFWARTDAARSIAVNVVQAHEPWGQLGLAAEAALTSEWKQFHFVFNASDSDTNARLGFSKLGGAGSQLWLAGISLRPGGVTGLRPGEGLAGEGLPAFAKRTVGERTPTAQRDWMRFLVETEDGYWQAMYHFLKDELKVKALVAGTIVGCSTPNLMAKLDWVDTHAYWQHPRFPNRPWDSEDWIVENRTMVNERGGTLPGLALKRVAGKPHACTEYNHPAPNTHGSEGMLLLAAYAALQDWDAIYAYTYAHSRNEGWDPRKISGFFDIDQHPTKMATLPAAVAMFLRGDVQPAKQVVTVPLPMEREVDLLRNARAWSLVDGGSVGIPREAPLLHRVAVALNGDPPDWPSLNFSQLSAGGNRFVSDTGELTWNLSEPKRGVVVVNTPRSKAVIGFGGGKRFELGEFVLEPATGLQNGWSAITLTALDGDVKPPRRWLLTATGYAENTGMVWKNAEKSSVGRAWGQSPSRVEGVSARLDTRPARRITGWALDERGQRREQLTNDPDGSLSLGPQWRTLWYELEVN